MNLLEDFIEIDFPKEENFLVVKETLSRIGVGNKTTQSLFPSCVLLHKKGKYYICHFKEMFLLDGKDADFTQNDRMRRNTIAYLLQEWGLIDVQDAKKIEDRVPISDIKIVSFKEKPEWKIIHKYTVGD